MKGATSAPRQSCPCPTVFLTASHCFAGFDDIDFAVTFDEVLDADGDGVVDPGVQLLTGTRHMNPLYACGGANNTMNPATGNAGTCYGESGGPHVLGTGASETNVVVAVTVTGDRWCRSTDKDYRLDTTSARHFLGQFVPLP